MGGGRFPLLIKSLTHEKLNNEYRALIPSLGGTGRSESFRTKRGCRGTDRRVQLRKAKVPSTGPNVDQVDFPVKLASSPLGNGGPIEG